MSSSSTSTTNIVPIPWLRDSEKCTCTIVDRIKARVSDFQTLYNDIFLTDKPAYDTDKGKENPHTVATFERVYLNKMYDNLDTLADLINLVPIKSEPLEQNTEKQIREGLNEASQKITDLGRQLRDLEDTKGVPDAMTTVRLGRLKQAAGLVWSIQNGWSKVNLWFCVHHAFADVNSHQSVPGLENTTRISTQSGTSNADYATRRERAGWCKSCHRTAILPRDGIKRSLLTSIASGDCPVVVLRAWSRKEPLIDNIHPMPDLRRTDWFQASVATGTGEYSLEQSINGTDDKLSYWASNEDFHAFLECVPRELLHTLQRDIGLHKIALARGQAAQADSIARTFSALSDIHGRLHVFDMKFHSDASLTESASMAFS